MHTTETHAVELLVTDTVVYEIIGQTAKTITLRQCARGERVSSDPSSMVVHTEALSDPNGVVYTVRLRKNGTFSIGGRRPLHFTSRPVFRTDYSW